MPNELSEGDRAFLTIGLWGFGLATAPVGLVFPLAFHAGYWWWSNAPERAARQVAKRAAREAERERELASMPVPKPTPDQVQAEAEARYLRNCERLLKSSLPPDLKDLRLREELLVLEQRLYDCME